MRRYLFPLLFLWLCLPASALAAERVALVIAPKMTFDGGPALYQATGSAVAVAESLEAAGYDVDRVIGAPAATVTYAMTEFALRLWQPDTVGILYFAGYACQVGGRNYLLAANSDASTAAAVTATSVSLDVFLQALAAAKASVVFLDPVPPGGACAAGLVAISPKSGSVMLSTQPGAAPALTEGPTTAFGAALAAALRQPGATLDGMLRKVAADVSARTGGGQVPWTLNHLDGSTELVPLDLPTGMARGGSDLPAVPGATSGGGSGGFDDSASAEPSSDVGGDEEERSVIEALNPPASATPPHRPATPRPPPAAEAELEPVGREVLPEPIPPPAPLPESASPPPPPPPPEPQPAPTAAAETVARHPTLDAPDEVIVGEVVTISLALTQEQFTPEVTVEAGPGVTVNEGGALNLPLPATQSEWPIDIDLFAPGFDLADGGEWSRRVTLFREGDSDTARFEVKARRVSGDAKPRQFMARFYHAGQYLGSATRAVTVYRNEDALEAAQAPGEGPAATLMAAPAEPAGDVTLTAGLEVADLDVTIHYDDPDRLGPGLIIIHSPHIAQPVTEEFDTPPGMAEWLDSRYRELVEAGLRVRGAQPIGGAAPAPDAASRKRFATRLAEGFGAELYDHYVPQSFKDELASLRREGKLHSIQITSNSPLLPWEIVRSRNDDGTLGSFLGVDYRLARWTPRAPGRQVDRPLSTLAFTGVATVAPAYDGSSELPFQQAELDALRKLSGFRLVQGDFLSFERLVGEVSTGFVHFSGHGEVSDPGTGSPVFAIRLTDQSLDPGTWAALDFAPQDKGNPFYFFNACDTGRARSLGGFVQGWGPAVLASGASGFVGGMWPLSDRTAAAFSTSFYGEISDRLPSGPVYIAEVLQHVRGKFYETGDPTYLAYTFYGNANLQVVGQ